MHGLDDIIAGVTSVALVLVTLILVRAWVYEPLRRHRHIWRFRLRASGGPTMIVENIEGGKTEIYLRPSTGSGAVVAVGQLVHALNASRPGFARHLTRRLRQPIAICFSEDPQANQLYASHDSVLVGGPKSNRFTKLVLGAFGIQLPDLPSPAERGISETERGRRAEGLRQQGEALKRRTASCLRSPGVASTLGVATQENTIYWFGRAVTGDVTDRRLQAGEPWEYVGVDYGVVLRLPNPSETAGGPRMVVVFGSQTFGVGIAAEWLANVRSRRITDLHARTVMARHPNLAVLVKAQVRNGVAEDPELVEIVVLPDQLDRRDDLSSDASRPTGGHDPAAKSAGNPQDS